MLVLILSYLGGVLTIFSPCVLPVIPFIFSRSDQSFRKSGLPTLAGMALSFAAFGALSVAGGKWVVQANQYGRTAALVIFTILGLTLIFEKFSEKVMGSFVKLGGALQRKADQKSGIGASLLLGVSLGLLWAPCAGPILGLVLAGAAIGNSSQQTLILLFAFAAGAATSLGIAIFASGKVLSSLKKNLDAEKWIKRALGVFVLCAVAAIALGLDTQLLAKFSFINTSKIEQKLVNQIGPSTNADATKENLLDDEGPMPSIEGATQWINSNPLTAESLRGKVVLIDFWTYSCINCLRSLPYVNAWAEKYKDKGLVVIGVHAPEFAFERDLDNVKKAVKDLKIGYPVAVDNENKIWNAFQNKYWPAHYFIDQQGRIRYHHFGEGSYEESEKVIQALLNDSSPVVASAVAASGVQAAAPIEKGISPETYLGAIRERGYMKKTKPGQLKLNEWTLAGDWKMEDRNSTLSTGQGDLSYRFKARDLHLVLGSKENRAVRFKVTIDGKSPGDDHGMDTDENGMGTVNSYRLYQLIRKKDSSGEHLFQIEFLDPGVEAFAFTFG